MMKETSTLATPDISMSSTTLSSNRLQSQTPEKQSSTSSTGGDNCQIKPIESQDWSSQPKDSSRKGCSGWLGESVAAPSLVPILILQAWATGVLDATTYADFNTFASNQTGNVILLTLSAVGTTKILLLLTGVSLAGFLSGAFIFGHLGHFFGVRRRAWLLLTTSIQFFLLLTSLLILLFAPNSYKPVTIPNQTGEEQPSTAYQGGSNQFLILLLFALMSGAQVVAARQSSCQELPTAPMTSPMVDLVSDKYLFSFLRTSDSYISSDLGGDKKRRVSMNSEKTVGNSLKCAAISSRNRRFAYIFAMISGSFIGAVLHRFVGSWAVVLVSSVCKLIALGMVGFAKAE